MIINLLELNLFNRGETCRTVFPDLLHVFYVTSAEQRHYWGDMMNQGNTIRLRSGYVPRLVSNLNSAELLLDYYPKEKTEALEHLDFAIKEFREMKMQPSLERALRRKDILKA
ncbi:hypothetical protein ACFLXY_07205 [Chloroflexota bacterium]